MKPPATFDPRLRPLVMLALAAATAAAFAGALGNGWILYDDPEYVTQNAHVTAGLTAASLRWGLHAAHGGNWHPLTTLAHLALVSLGGPGPRPHHAASVALHALAAVLLALALARLSGAWWRSVLVAALFALHPLRVESVAWASELKDALSGALFAATLLAYARWAERPAPARRALVIALGALGLAAKPMLVTLPFVLVLLDAWPLGRLRGLAVPARAGAPVRAPQRSLGGLVAEKWPLLALAAASSAITFAVQRASGAVNANVAAPLGARVTNALVSCWRYVGLELWPHALIPFHLLAHAPDVPRGALAALALVAATALAAWRVRTQPWWLVGWLWYLGMLVPVLGLVQVGMQSHADRYTYLPAIGLGLAAVWALDAVLPAVPAVRRAAALACVVLLAVLGVATARQVARWHTDETLWEWTLGVDPDNAVAHQCLGSQLLGQGRTAEALPHFEAALRSVPGFTDARIDLGVALATLGRYDDALREYRSAALTRDDAVVHRNLALALVHLGRATEAIAEFEATLDRDPGDLDSAVELGQIVRRVGPAHEAVPRLRRALALHPDEMPLGVYLAEALARDGAEAEALAAFREIDARQPGASVARNAIAWLLATAADPHLRDGAEAVRLAEYDVANGPKDMPELLGTLAAAYAEAGRFPDAVRMGERVLARARATGDTTNAAQVERELACFRAGRPYHGGAR